MIAFRILGPFEVVEGDRPVAVGGPKPRALLAVLVLHRGEVVSSDRLIDALWGERPPATAAKTVQVFVSSLRKTLGDGLLVTRGRGYMLEIDAGQLDLDRFEQLAAEGRSALESDDPQLAARRLREGLALWRGPPLADLAYESFAQAAIGRLEEERLATLEDRIDADLALGRHAALVGELEALVAEHPLRERLQGQLMLALYRSGRQADALERYQRARRGLVDELGIEPGPALKELERAILAHDPALDAPARASGPRPTAHVRRGGVLITGGGALLLAALALVAVMLSRGAGRVRVAPNSVAAIDPHSNRVAGAIQVGVRPGAIAYGSGSLWVANQDDRTVSRVDPRTLQTLQAIPVGQLPTGIAAGPGQVWVATANLTPDANAVSVTRIDPRFNSFTPVPIGNVVTGAPEAVAAQGDQVWVAPGAGLLTRLDGTSRRIIQRLDPNASPTAIAIGSDGAVWVTDNSADNVTRVDPTGLLTPIPVGNGPSGIAVGEGGVWVADSLDNAVVRIDPSTPAVTETIPVGNSPAGITVGAGSVWVADSGDGTVDRIDPRRDKVIARIAVGASPQALTVANGRVWVTVDAPSIAPGPTGGTTLRIDWPTGPESMDPALAQDPQGWQLLQAMCAKLLNFPDKPGPAGEQPTPEVAQSLPERSPDGRTYTFKIRPGFRFSPTSNEPVTAQTFKDSMERAFNPAMKSILEPDFSDIVGMNAYQTGKTHHISGIVARGDTLVVRLIAPRPDLLARLTQQATCAVPSDTPLDPNGVRTLPSAGPYYLQSFTPGQAVVLVRNPNYHGSRPHNFERIQVAIGMSTGRAVAAVKTGTADNTTLNLASGSSGLPVSLATEATRLAAAYGPGSTAAEHGRHQYFVNPLTSVDSFLFNTHRPLFSDVRLRRAVNYAINRRALAALGGGSAALPDHPIDHYLPPGIPGYRNAHVYPVTPDLAKARALATGHGRTAILDTANFPPLPQQAQVVKTDLAAIGLRVQIQILTLQTLVPRLTKHGAPFDLVWFGWLPDFPDPYAMLNEVLEDGYAPAFNDPTYQRKLAGAARLSGPNRYLTYGKLDLDLARNAAPLAAYGNTLNYDFFSTRIGCQTFGFYGIDLNALCVR